MTRAIEFSEGEIYHLYNRGTDKRIIFNDDADYERFISLLYLANTSATIHISDHIGWTTDELLGIDRDNTLVDIMSYCLMPNHFHLIIREHSAGGISKFMQKLGNGYTGYFNVKNDRSGSLFQGTFKARHVATDRYLSYLLSYIHLNPVKLINPLWKEKGITDLGATEKFLRAFPYSSFLDYCGSKRSETRIINMGAFPTEFTAPSDFANSVREWLTFKPE